MNKNGFFLLLFIVTVFLLSYKLSGHIQNFFLNVADSIKMGYINSYESLEDALKTHFNQKETIEFLVKANEKLRKQSIVYKYYKNELDRLSSSIGVKPDTNVTLKAARTISYVSMGDYKKIWLNFEPTSQKKIYGVLQNDAAAGVLIPENGRSLVLLNGNKKCSYSVYIGEKKAPGIISGGDDENNLIVNYIPSWMNIKLGDKVITSGLDNIFFEGIAVGNVVKIENEDGYQKALIEPKADILHPGYFWVIDN
ncbi:MAG: rod shape-determining protein MreC [Campylobacterales bacterium]